MKTRLTLVILVVLATLVAASPALAAGPANQNRHENQNRNKIGGQPETSPGMPIFTLTGTITALGSDSITVLAHNGNRFVKPYIGQDLVVLVTDGTRYREYTPEGCVPIGFGDLQVGDTISIHGTSSEGTFTALRVTVGVPCCGL
jgi:hypothetical protein